MGSGELQSSILANEYASIKKMKVDILVFSAHPDDAELSCSGTIASHIHQGKKVGIIDLTRGELGTRGNPEKREKEAARSKEILKLSSRENLGMPDGFFDLSKKNILSVAGKVRQYRPDIVLANAIRDRHPDHARAAKLVDEACFHAGLMKISIMGPDGEPLDAWRPKAVYHYIQSYYIEPDFIVDISGFWEIKKHSIMAFGSQFFDPESDEPETYISNPQFLDFLESRCKMWGQMIGTRYGEGFTVNRNIGIGNLFDMI
jgi:bacillithiol biosynthesis deacetylase BshB1